MLIARAEFYTGFARQPADEVGCAVVADEKSVQDRRVKEKLFECWFSAVLSVETTCRAPVNFSLKLRTSPAVSVGQRPRPRSFIS